MNRITQASFGTIILILCFSVAGAQKSSDRNKTTKKPATAQPSPTPMTEPVIISRAEDFPVDGNVLPQTVTDAVRAAGLQDRSETDKLIAELNARIKALETDKKDDYDAKQKRLALNLDILTKAEQRAESLRKQSFELLERENAVRTKLDQIEVDLRPESINRQIAFAGSLRPEELRAARKRNLETERTNQQNLLQDIQRTKASLDANVLKADLLVEKLRVKLEAEIDAALADPTDKP